MEDTDVSRRATATGTVVYGEETTGADDEETTVVSNETDETIVSQPVPDETSCPYCGGTPTDASAQNHHLSAMGYLHDDIQMECAECDSTWACGVPVGEFEDERAQELWCDSCEQRLMRVHRIHPDWDSTSDRRVIRIHLKCPNCFYFTKLARQCGPRGISLMGYPDITGSTDGADAFGWPDDD